MFANRFTALVYACSLAGTLNRNLLLTLAEASFFRLRWSAPILDETERAIEQILAHIGPDPNRSSNEAPTSGACLRPTLICSALGSPTGSRWPAPPCGLELRELCRIEVEAAVPGPTRY